MKIPEYKLGQKIIIKLPFENAKANVSLRMNVEVEICSISYNPFARTTDPLLFYYDVLVTKAHNRIPFSETELMTLEEEAKEDD